MGIQDKAKKVVELLDQFDNWEDRYREIIKLGKTLGPMPEEYKTEANKVKGCQSQLWLHAEMQGDNVVFLADSDASIVRGIVAVIFRVYSNNTPEEILSLKPTFIDEIGLRQHLSMSRASGLSSVLKQISFYALAFQAKQQMS